MAKQIEMPKAYPVPSNWIWTELGKLVQILSGYPFQSSLFENDESNGRPLIRIRDIVAGETYTYTSEDCPDEYIVKSGEILIGMDGDFNIAKWQSNDALLNQRVCKITSKSDVLLNDYMFYFLPETLKKINDATPSVTVKHLSTKTIEKILIPLPPLAEQKRIVEQIENLFSKLDEAKEKAEVVLASYDNRIQAILYEAFSGKLTTSWRAKNNLDLGSWERKSFKDICEIVRGGSPRPAGNPEFYDGPIPFMKVADITNNEGPYVSKAEYSIKEAGLKKTRLVEKNTLLLTNSGATLGVPAITTIQTTFNDGIAAFLNLEEESLLFYYYFWTSKTKVLRAINKGAAQPNLNTTIIGDIEIDLPTLAEQAEIVKIIDRIIEKERQVRDTAERLIDNIDVMKKSVLAKAFRGELGTNIPEDENALLLLESIIYG